VANQLKLIQTRIPDKEYKKLVRAQKRAGELSLAGYLRKLVISHNEDQAKKERN
jgi:hypothetical protein